VAVRLDALPGRVFFLADDKIDIFLYSAAGSTQALARVGHLPIHTPQSAIEPSVRARTLFKLWIPTPFAGSAVGGQRTVTLNIIPPPSVALETAVDTVQREVIQHLQDTGTAPPGVSLDISGANDQLQTTREVLSGNLLVAVLLC